MEISQLREEFCKRYGEGSTRVFIGPARVNLIGEHTDYNGGYVFPCAIDLRSACVVRVRDDGKLNLSSTSYPKSVSVDISDLSCYKDIEWGNYQIGVAHIMKERGYTLTGMDVLFDETVPHGSGLSSSAAIEVAMACAIATLDSEKTGKKVDNVELAIIARSAENDYVGMNCGIMDQFASAMGKEDNVILLRCSDLSYSYAPLCLGKHELIITNTCKPRSLITSAYNERRAECEQALKDISVEYPVDCLADITPQKFEEIKHLIKDPVCMRRAHHIVYENARTIKAAEVLSKGDIHSFGKLMLESHMSLREKYEVTGFELDTLYDVSLKQEGVIGTRMTGAGFGGCTVTIVEKQYSDAFRQNVAVEYTKKTNLIPQFYSVTPAQGAREFRD